MTVMTLLDELTQRGVELAVAGDRLRYRPARAVGPELRYRLAEHKAELMTMLQRSGVIIHGPDDLPGDWRVDFEERAAVREHEGGQAKEYAEAEALKEIISEMQRAGIR